MFLFLFSCLPLLLSTTATNYSFPDANISLVTVSTGTIQYTTGQDACKQLIARNSSVHHINTNSTYQNWNKGQITTPISTAFGPPVQTSEYMAVSQDELSVAIAAHQSATTQSFRHIFDVNANFQITNVDVYPEAYFTDSIATNGTILYNLQRDPLQIQPSYIYETLPDKTIINSVQLSNAFTKMEISPDYQKIIAWTQLSTIQLIEATTLSLLNSHSPTNPSAGSTKTVTFSMDSSLVILETDTFNPIQILRTTDLSLVYEVPVGYTVFEAHFVNNSNEFIIVFAQTTTFVVNLTSGNQYPIQYFDGVDFATDFDNNLFVCHNNVITQTSLSLEYIPPPLLPSTDGQFFVKLDIEDSPEETAYNIITTPLFMMTNATNFISSMTSSTPVSIFFLSFLNYFTLSSLYVLLDFPIPEHIYKYLGLVYSSINSQILEIIGINIKLLPYSDEKVSSKRGLHFGVTSDLLSSQTNTLLFMVGNILVIFILTWLVSLLKKGNPLRQVVRKQKWNMIYGHLINIIMPLTLPWTFLMLFAGVRNTATKLNSCCYLLIYFFGVFFPIYYFFDLLQERELKLIKQRNKKKEQWKERQIEKFINEKNLRKKNKSKQLSVNKKKQKNCKKQKTNTKKMTKKQEKNSTLQKQNQNLRKLFKNRDKNGVVAMQRKKNKTIKLKLVLEGQQKFIEERITFSQLVTIEITEQWYACQANFLIPCLVLLEDPKIFLVVIQIYTILGMVISFKRTEMRVNSFILSIYPFLFHVCFLVFYLSSSIKVLILAELVCLGVYLLGLVHHIATIIFQIIKFFIKLVKKCMKKNRVKPKKNQENKVIIEENAQNNKRTSQKQKSTRKNIEDENKNGSNSGKKQPKTKIKKKKDGKNKQALQINYRSSKQK